MQVNVKCDDWVLNTDLMNQLTNLFHRTFRREFRSRGPELKQKLRKIAELIHERKGDKHASISLKAGFCKNMALELLETMALEEGRLYRVLTDKEYVPCNSLAEMMQNIARFRADTSGSLIKERYYLQQEGEGTRHCIDTMEDAYAFFDELLDAAMGAAGGDAFLTLYYLLFFMDANWQHLESCPLIKKEMETRRNYSFRDVHLEGKLSYIIASKFANRYFRSSRTGKARIRQMTPINNVVLGKLFAHLRDVNAQMWEISDLFEHATYKANIFLLPSAL